MYMRKILTLLIGALLITTSVAACGGGIASQPAASSQTEGNFKIELTTEPSPPTQGHVTFIVNVKDKNDQPVEDADVNVSYTMTTMGMGITSGKATDEGKSVYTIRSTINHGGGLRVVIAVEKEGLGKGTKDVRIDLK